VAGAATRDGDEMVLGVCVDALADIAKLGIDSTCRQQDCEPKARIILIDAVPQRAIPSQEVSAPHRNRGCDHDPATLQGVGSENRAWAQRLALRWQCRSRLPQAGRGSIAFTMTCSTRRPTALYRWVHHDAPRQSRRERYDRDRRSRIRGRYLSIGSRRTLLVHALVMPGHALGHAWSCPGSCLVLSLPGSWQRTGGDVLHCADQPDQARGWGRAEATSTA
jgi:hypothetical protein